MNQCQVSQVKGGEMNTHSKITTLESQHLDKTVLPRGGAYYDKMALKLFNLYEAAEIDVPRCN